MGHRPTSGLWRAWLTSPTVRDFERGRLDGETFAARLIRIRSRIDAEQFLPAFVRGRAGRSRAHRSVGALRPGIVRATLSNSNALHWPRFLDEMDFERHFDHHFASHLIDRIKPDHDAFEHVATTLGIEPARSCSSTTTRSTSTQRACSACRRGAALARRRCARCSQHAASGSLTHRLVGSRANLEDQRRVTTRETDGHSHTTARSKRQIGVAAAFKGYIEFYKATVADEVIEATWHECSKVARFPHRPRGGRRRRSTDRHRAHSVSSLDVGADALLLSGRPVRRAVAARQRYRSRIDRGGLSRSRCARLRAHVLDDARVQLSRARPLRPDGNENTVRAIP